MGTRQWAVGMRCPSLVVLCVFSLHREEEILRRTHEPVDKSPARTGPLNILISQFPFSSQTHQFSRTGRPDSQAADDSF